MLLFQSPPPTRYDLRFTLAGFPVRVHPLFWLIAVLLGSSGDVLLLPIWVLAVFVSIVIHELGHALAFRRYGLSSQIVLHGAGGLTIPESTPWGSQWANVALGPRQEIFISVAGPGAGFIFAGLIMAVVAAVGGSVYTTRLLGFIPLPAAASLPFASAILNPFVTILLWVSVFWGLINLLPVYPLDGGNVARYILLQVDPVGGIRKSLWLSVITGSVIALAAFFALRSLYMGLLFGILAFQSYQMLQNRF